MALKTIVLVHGFWTDASSYRLIIPLLLAKGYEVIAVQNPLRSLDDDIETTKRALARVEGQCLLVGHSWGGMVITAAGQDDRVAGLIYIAALAPDVGESMADLLSKYEPPSQYLQAQEGFIWISAIGVQQVLAQDLSVDQAGLVYATQAPPAAALITAKVNAAAWQIKPSWYVVASEDKSVPPNLQRALSTRIEATTVAINSGHLLLLSHPQEIVDVILAAAESIKSALRQ